MTDRHYAMFGAQSSFTGDSCEIEVSRVQSTNASTCTVTHETRNTG